MNGTRLPRRTLMALMLAALAAAQRPPQNGSISGVVVDAATRTPLADVSVLLQWKRVETDAQGRFTFQQVPAGSYWISAHQYSDSDTGSGGISLALKEGQDLGPVEIRIHAAGSISGRVLNESKEPLTGIAVFLLEGRFAPGELMYTPRQSVLTGPKGEFRFERVASGRSYLLMAKNLTASTVGAPSVPARSVICR